MTLADMVVIVPTGAKSVFEVRLRVGDIDRVLGTATTRDAAERLRDKALSEIFDEALHAIKF